MGIVPYENLQKYPAYILMNVGIDLPTPMRVVPTLILPGGYEESHISRLIRSFPQYAHKANTSTDPVARSILIKFMSHLSDTGRSGGMIHLFGFVDYPINQELFRKGIYLLKLKHSRLSVMNLERVLPMFHQHDICTMQWEYYRDIANLTIVTDTWGSKTPGMYSIKCYTTTAASPDFEELLVSVESYDRLREKGRWNARYEMVSPDSLEARTCSMLKHSVFNVANMACNPMYFNLGNSDRSII